MSFASLRVLFCVAATDGQSHARFDRARAMARELGVRPLLAVRGSDASRAAALALGVDVVAGGAATAICAMQPDLVVVDEPSQARAQEAIGAASRTGAAVLRINDSSRFDDRQRAPRVVAVAAALSQGTTSWLL